MTFFIDGQQNVMTPSLGNIDPDSVTSAISMVRRSLRYDAATSRAHEEELDSAIAAYSTCEGAAAVAHVVDAIPSLKEAQTRLASEPSSERDVAFHVRHYSDSDAAAADALCASCSPEMKRLAGTLNKSLETYWARRNKPIDGKARLSWECEGRVSIGALGTAYATALGSC